jgi:hypothetical protein
VAPASYAERGRQLCATADTATADGRKGAKRIFVNFVVAEIVVGKLAGVVEIGRGVKDLPCASLGGWDPP